MGSFLNNPNISAGILFRMRNKVGEVKFRGVPAYNLYAVFDITGDEEMAQYRLGEAEKILGKNVIMKFPN